MVIEEPKWNIPKKPVKSSWRDPHSFRFWMLFTTCVISIFVIPMMSYNIWIAEGFSGLLSFVMGIGALLAIIAVFVAIFQLKESLRTRRMEIAMTFFELFGCEESRQEREHVLKKLPDPKDMTQEDWEKSWNVLAKLSRAGILLYYGFVDERLVLHTYHGMFIMLWDKLRPCVMHVRETFPIYHTLTEYLAKKSWEWRKQMGYEGPIKHFDNLPVV